MVHCCHFAFLKWVFSSFASLSRVGEFHLALSFSQVGYGKTAISLALICSAPAPALDSRRSVDGHTQGSMEDCFPDDVLSHNFHGPHSHSTPRLDSPHFCGTFLRLFRQQGMNGGGTTLPLPTVPGCPPIPGRIPVRATLILVPAQLMRQWPSEIEKFTGERLRVVAGRSALGPGCPKYQKEEVEEVSKTFLPKTFVYEVPHFVLVITLCVIPPVGRAKLQGHQAQALRGCGPWPTSTACW